MEIKHLKQDNSYGCGAFSYAMLFGIPFQQAKKEVKCTSKGTFHINVIKAIQKRGINCFSVLIRQDYNDCFWFLKNISFKYPVYVSGEYHERIRAVRHHASLWADGYIYDPSEDEKVPVESYGHTFDRKLKIKHIIIVDIERKDYIKNLQLN